MIFVQIAAYRDPELAPTLRDLFAKAEHPDELRVAVCHQHGEGEDFTGEFRRLPQVMIDDVPAEESRGCCWARAKTQTRYDGEEFTLQLDSHHRFEPDWDTLCKEMLSACPSDNPILTAYLGGYTPGGKVHNNPPWVMVPKHGFTKDGALLCVPKPPADKTPRAHPIPARFLSAHFLFTRGAFVEDVPYDPRLYFTGEEASLGVRAWTHGYGLFHPHQPIAWHEYTRQGRARHWDDHKISEADGISKARVRKLLGMEDNAEDLTGFNLGSVRSLADYERFAGVDFKGRRFRSGCMAGVDPPTSVEDAWAIDRRVLVHWPNELEIPDDCTHVAYFVDDAENLGMWHQNATKAQGFMIDPVIEFCSAREPARLIVWPHTAKGPCPKKYQIALSEKVVYTCG